MGDPKPEAAAERYDRTVSAREALYGEFIQQPARLLAHAAENEDGSLSEMVPLFALTARMRLVASPEVIAEAEKFLQAAINLYHEPYVPATAEHPASAARRSLESLQRSLQARARERAALRLILSSRPA